MSTIVSRLCPTALPSRRSRRCPTGGAQGRSGSRPAVAVAPAGPAAAEALVEAAIDRFEDPDAATTQGSGVGEDGGGRFGTGPARPTPHGWAKRKMHQKMHKNTPKTNDGVFFSRLGVWDKFHVQSLWVPRGTGPEFYPSNDGKNPSFGRVFPSKPGFFPSQTNVQSLWVHREINWMWRFLILF